MSASRERLDDGERREILERGASFTKCMGVKESWLRPESTSHLFLLKYKC